MRTYWNSANCEPDVTGTSGGQQRHPQLTGGDAAVRPTHGAAGLIDAVPTMGHPPRAISASRPRSVMTMFR